MYKALHCYQITEANALKKKIKKKEFLMNILNTLPFEDAKILPPQSAPISQNSGGWGTDWNLIGIGITNL